MKKIANEKNSKPQGDSHGVWEMVLRIANEFEYIVGALALLGLVALLSISILARYVGGVSIPWTEELGRFMFIAVIFSTISYGARQHRHIRVRLFVEKFVSKKAALYVYTLGDFMWLGLNGVVLYGSYVIIAEMFQWPFSSPVLNVPMYYIYSIIPIFFVTISIRIIQGIVARHTGVNIDSHSGESV